MFLQIIVFKEFFAQLDLPFSAIRGELLELKVLVFNYLTTKQKVDSRHSIGFTFFYVDLMYLYVPVYFLSASISYNRDLFLTDLNLVMCMTLFHVDKTFIFSSFWQLSCNIIQDISSPSPLIPNFNRLDNKKMLDILFFVRTWPQMTRK